MNRKWFHGASHPFGLPSVIQILLEVLGMIPFRQPAIVRRSVLWMLAFSLVVSGAGCGLPPKWHAFAKKLPEATPEDPAYQMLCVWEPAEGIGPDKLPTRGFAGKITFFTRKQKTGVRVNGDVRIYVYDDQSPVEERGKPIHQWDFLGDAWSIHLQNSSLGPSYSVFIPYSRKGGQQALCAVRVRFTAENGTPLYSDTVAVMLPGQLQKKSDRPVNGDAQSDKRSGLSSLTIPLKEKAKPDWADNPTGKTEMQRTVAPVSELAGKTLQSLQTSEESPSDDGVAGKSSVMTALPPAPGSVPAPPPAVFEENPVPDFPATNPFADSETTPPPRPEDSLPYGPATQPSAGEQHPLGDIGLSSEFGSNPFDR